jgi:hypothetical protein
MLVVTGFTSVLVALAQLLPACCAAIGLSRLGALLAWQRRAGKEATRRPRA